MYQLIKQADFRNSIIPAAHGGGVTGDAIKTGLGYANSVIITIGAALAADVTFKVEHTFEDIANSGNPDNSGWTSVSIQPECDDPAGTAAVDLQYVAAAGTEDKVYEIGIPSNAAFMRVVSDAAGDYAALIRTDRKRRR